MRDSISAIIFTLAAIFAVLFTLSGIATWFTSAAVADAIVAALSVPAFLGLVLSGLLGVAVNEVRP